MYSYIEMALGSQSRGAGAIAENSAPWEPKLGTYGAEKEPKLGLPNQLPNQLRSWKPNGSAMREQA